MTDHCPGTYRTNRMLRCSLHLTAFCCVILAGAVMAADPAEPVDYRGAIEQFRRLVQEELQRGILTGVSVALIDGQRVVLADGFGMADTEQQIPASASTVYRVGSISKLFTALSVMQQVERGQLDLDAPITRYLPDFRMADPFIDARPITLRQLMCHRSGVVRESPIGGYFDPHEPTVAQSVASLESCALVNPPGTKTRYSNIGVTVVGQVVAAVAGQAFEPYQQEHILRPLGMEQTAWRMNDQLRKQLAVGYMRVADGNGGFSHTQAPTFELGTIPAGNLYSSAQDMARFARMVLAQGRMGEHQLLQATTWQPMFEPQLTHEKTGFGLGFFVGTFSGHKAVRHTGAVYGFSTSIEVLPEPALAVVVLANEDVVPGPVMRISEAGLALLLQAKTGQKPAEPPPVVDVTTQHLARLVGHYESPSYWAEFKLVEGALIADISGQPMTLTAVGPSKFEADGRFVYRAVVEFKLDDEGNAIGVSALGQSFGRVPTTGAPPIPAAWRKYLGSYGPDFIPLVVSARHGHLYAMTENMVDYRLTPVNQQVFRMPEGLYADEYLVFQIDSQGQVPGACLANMMLLRNE